jgi:uncharacterized membrane protein
MKTYARAYRSLAKTITWRLSALVATMLLVWCFCREVDKAVGIGLAEFFLKMAAYYVHERIWARVSWGAVARE